MKKISRLLLPVIVLAIGIAAAVFFVKTRPKAKRVRPKAVVPLVKVQKMQLVSRRVDVSGMGVVVADRVVSIQPEVSGRLVQVSPSLQEGGRFERGDVIARIDDRDYRLVVQQREVDVVRARLEVDLERGRGAVARREWGLLKAGLKTTAKGRSLALREPEMKAALAKVRAAESALGRARLAVSRTVLRAPFDALVQKRRVSVGQLVFPQSVLATVVSTDRFLVQVSVPVEDLVWIDRPGLDGKGGASAEIVQRGVNGGTARRRGDVIQLLGDLDPQGRMARLLIAVDRPLELSSLAPSHKADVSGMRTPLLLGSYVEVTIRGHQLENVYDVPRFALREGSRLWMMDAQDRLAIRDAVVVRRLGTRVFLKTKPSPGDRLVLSGLSLPVSGVSLRVQGMPAEVSPVAVDVPARREEVTP